MPALAPGLLLSVALLAADAPAPRRGARYPVPQEEAGLYRRVHTPREWTVRYVHRVRNLTKSPLRQVEVAIALPRDDDRQRIQELVLDPRPQKTAKDGWDQESACWLFDEVPAGGEVEAVLEVKVILRDLELLITEGDVGSLDQLPARLVQHYLRNNENYRLDEGIVQRAAQRLSAPGIGVLEKVRRIHDFVIDALEYSRDGQWDSADSVLRQGKGSCSEYSYLMIALLRSNGIPARYAGGTWLEKDGASPPRDFHAEEGSAHVDQIFHRWVEVYLPLVGWFPIDPTQDDAAEKEGSPYRYFGRLPWSYLAMAHGDGDRLESGLLGSDYRSSSKWLARPRVQGEEIMVERFATWRPTQRGKPEATQLGN